MNCQSVLERLDKMLFEMLIGTVVRTSRAREREASGLMGAPFTRSAPIYLNSVTALGVRHG